MVVEAEADAAVEAAAYRAETAAVAVGVSYFDPCSGGSNSGFPNLSSKHAALGDLF